MEEYKIVYKGVLPTATQESAEAKFAALFKLTPEKAAAILARSNVSLRSNLDKKTADLFLRKLTAAGLDVVIKAMPVAAAASGKAQFDAKPVAAATVEGVVNPRFLPRSEKPLTTSLGASPNTNEETSDNKILSFQFNGSGPEYFRIWIVNTLLTIVTLGIYSAWAKVRTQQYFHANTELEGASFQYLANPKQIFRGQAIAAVVFGAYFLSGYVSATSQIIVTLILLVIAPALLVLSMSFRLRYSSWRNVTFDFNRDFVHAYKMMAAPVFIVMLMYFSSYSIGEMAGSKPANINWAALVPFIASFALFYLAFPWMQFLFNRYLVNNTMYGTRNFKFTATARQYYKMYGSITLQMVVLGAAAIFVGGGLSKMLVKLLADVPGGAKTFSIIFFMLIFLPLSLWYFSYTQAKKFNLRYNGTSIGRYTFSCDVSALILLWLYVSNTIAILFTLGLYIPWAKIRTVTYRLSCLKINLVGAANSFYNSQSDTDADATANELTGFFDIDIAL